MLTCKQVSRSLEETDYQELGPFARFMMRVHIALCVVCGKYNRQRMTMHDTVRGFLEHEQDASSGASESLEAASRERLRTALRDAKE